MKSAFAVAAFLLPALAFAQFGLGTTEALVLSVTPENPRPGGVITITPQSGLVNLANSTMTVSVGGKQTYSGNARPVGVTLAPVGQATAITVRISSQGQSYAKTLTLRPGDVSLVVEPIATAPALYAGKPLVPEGGSVRLVAMADFRSSASTRLDPDTLSYSWRVDGTALLKESGIGRSTIIVSAPLAFRTGAVSVLVQSPGGSLSGGDAVSLSSRSPTLRLYLLDPLQGVLFDHALTRSYTFTKSEATFMAVPYSFSPTVGPQFQWFLNGAASETGPMITLRPEGSGRGSSSLSVTAPTGIETALAALSLTFGEGPNLFGL